MAKKPSNRNPYAFTPIILDQDSHEKRRVIQQLPVVHQTETLQKFFGSSVDHLFDPGKGRPINGYVGQKPLWYDPDQDYYLAENTTDRTFYQLEASMVSKNTEGQLTDLLPYPDLVNQLRFQGALTNNHNRLFSQDYYTWCPPIDLDKIVNFRQYCWLPIDDIQNSQTGIRVNGPTQVMTSAGNTSTYALPGFGAGADTELATFYDRSVLVTSLIHAEVDGVSRTFSYNTGDDHITFDARPAADAMVSISVYSDLENNAIGLAGVNPKAFGGVLLSSGMRVIINLDKNSDYKNNKIYIVENVGKSIEVLEEVDYNAGARPDYMVMARGAANRNEWSTRNRWFHVSTLPDSMDADYVLAHRATRPIIEFNRDLELYNYGLDRRLDVGLVVEDIEDLNAYMNQYPQDITLNGVRITTRGSNLINVPAVNPITGITYGDVTSIRLMIRNTVNELLNNNVFVLVNQGGVLKLILETDGQNPSGEPVFGEVFRVELGTYAGKNLNWDGANWVASQAKTAVNQAPLFELYDLNSVSLRDPGLYPNSTFKGSKIFSYQIDTTGARVADAILGLPLVHDNKGQILFENFMSTQTHQYVVGGKFLDITGFYFHKTGNIDASLESFSNDWFKAPDKTRQFMVDRYVSDGRTRLFAISQPASEMTVTLGRVDDSKSFQQTTLVEDRDYIRVDRKIMLMSVKTGDIIEIRTFNNSNPPLDAQGHYEVPLNLQANPDNAEVGTLTKGDFYDHFSEIMKKQAGFVGAEYSDNNYRDTAKAPNLGTHVIQHSAGLLKTMFLASQAQLDIMSAIRYSDSEYARFKDKFQQKILDYSLRGKLANAVSFDVWINTALDELNKGKTKHFPYYLSGMAQNAANQLPTFIPTSPSFLGVYPLYAPQMLSQGVMDAQGNQATVWFVRGHDGSLTQGQNETVANVLLALEQRIYDSVPENIRNRERPACDWQEAYGDEYRTNDYSYAEYLQILRPSFERWCVNYRQDYKTNDTFVAKDPWTWNWSTIPTVNGDLVPGHWRGIYEKFFGTQRPDLTPWESLGFTIKPDWWNDRYGPAPYTSENIVLWDDLERGYIHKGDRQGINASWARPGLSAYMPVDLKGRLRHPGPRELIAFKVVDDNTDLSYATNADQWEDTHDEGVLGCGICSTIPLDQERSGEWNWGDVSPVEQSWRRSSAFAFACASASYLMKPAKFIELGWNTKDLQLFFKGTENEQWLNQDTKGRSRHADLQVHGEVLEDFSLVTKVGIQQWVSDFLASKNTAINDAFATHIRGLGSQLSYKVGGFTDASTLVVVSDAFGRVPSEDVTVSLYRSPSIREEVYSGVSIQYNGNGYEVFGYNAIDPYFTVLPGAVNGNKISVGNGATSAALPSWNPNTYYSVNLTLKYQDNFYRCVKSHTSSTYFEADYWTQVARPQYADGTALVWYLEAELDAVEQKVAYGTVFKTPQQVADFLNGYERSLKSRGWVFEDVQTDESEIKDWRTALKNFITWSHNPTLTAGNYLSLSPCSSLVQFNSDHGAIQPIEQIVNGLYAIVNQKGQPIDSQLTRVIRNDGNLSVSCADTKTGIFGLRLYISELEHVLVFNNSTIFGDTIYNPLLNIHQPRLRLQGFKTVNWKGRVDAPGFIVTGDTLTPNFERAADDFRRFFESESMENKKLQDRARANFGYEERDYLNNLLLTPTNQFEFYQGMIQQKGSPTAMRRLLRSNFIRHNKGLTLFEEWAFRVGDYGGQDVTPSLDIQILQSEFKHNPQLISFENAPLGSTITNIYGQVKVVDFVQDGKLTQFDSRWHWRPDMNEINWPVRDFNQGEAPLPTAGYVNLDEVRFTVPTNAEFENFFGKQEGTVEKVLDGDRVWVYGIGEKDSQGKPDFNQWQTYKFNYTNYDFTNTFAPTYQGMGTVVQLNNPVQGYVTPSSAGDSFYISQPLLTGALDDNGYAVSGEKLVIKNLNDSDLSPLTTYKPRFASKVKTDLQGSSIYVMGFVPEVNQYIKSIKVVVEEPFADGATLEVGTDSKFDEFIAIREETVRPIYPTNYDNEAVLVQTPSTSYLPAVDGSEGPTTADVNLIRVGRVVNFCAETIVEWTWVRAADQASFTGNSTFLRPSDYTTASNPNDAYVQTIQLPILSEATGLGSEGTLTIKTNGVVSDSQYLTFVRSTSAAINSVDLTRVATYTFDATHFAKYPYNTNLAGVARNMIATLNANGTIGKAHIEVDYFYTQGFELVENVDGTDRPVVGNMGGGTGSLYTWLKTRYTTLSEVPTLGTLWDDGDIIEVDSAVYDTGRWSVYQRSGSTWNEVRHQNRKINSDLLTSAAIFNSQENRLKLILQLYDPYKGYIPGVADRELEFKTLTDPATYDDGRLVWGKAQVGQLWWDQSAVRYLDYEIFDTLAGGTNYSWKNWGRVAPNSNVNIYQWVRSPVAPNGWNAYVASKAALNIDNKPSGTVDNEQINYVTATEWNDDIQADETIYYFWVLNATVVPGIPSRKLSAQQVSNIILNPSSNDIPFFAVIDTNKVIIGGIKQFLNETDTVLKVKWTKESDIINNHHKQWMILREEDERNTIDDNLWNKMRDSLVGWDETQLSVPDIKLPKAQQVGALIRPRQSWFPTDVAPVSGQRPSRGARAAFVDTMNNIFAAQPFIDQWFNFADVFDKGEALPTSDRYVATALDIADLKNLLPASLNQVQVNECVLIQNTTEAAGFWTLWKLVEIAGVRTFILEDFQKWRMQEGELWNLTDWYATGWSAKNFPNYRFPTYAARDAAGNLDITLLKGTLVQIDQQTPTDLRWSWDVYTSTTKYQVAKHNATMLLSDAFYDNSRVEFGPKQVDALRSASIETRITPDRIQELADLVNYRDGSSEMKFMLDSFRTELFDVLQKNALFFSMVKSAFKQSQVVDWAFKTSFLYLGGYSETLRQSPVAVADQIDNVIAYLEEVKPYHVKIREYVRRVSYGPDVANLAITDFDKPVYPAGSANRVLDVNNPVDQNIMDLQRPWKDWYDNYQKPNRDLTKWDKDWNGVRGMKIKVKFDRISCGTIRGWDTHPWDPALLVYSQLGGTTQSLSGLNALYRSGPAPGANYYRDTTVETIEDRNFLVRKGLVTPDRSGTIVTVLTEGTHYMWSGNDWIKFEALGWDQDPDMGTASRIDESYHPLPGMTRADDAGLIAGCEFDGTTITDTFQSDQWDMFEWDTTGYGQGLREHTGVDVDLIDGNSTPADENLPEYIAVTGNKFSQPAIEGNRPHELINIRGIENLIINTTQSGVAYQKSSMDPKGRWTDVRTGASSLTFLAWDQTAFTVSLSVPSWSEDAQGFTPLHDPQNPSTGFIRDVMISKGYRSASMVDMTSGGEKTFKLRDVTASEGIPAGLMGNNVKVAVVNPKDPSKRAIGVLTSTKGSEKNAWNGTLSVTFTDGFVNLGSGKSWNIIPVDMFNEPGIVWIGNARFTYTDVVFNGNTVVLSNAKLSGNTLAPLTITDTTVALTHMSPVFDGSKQRQLGE